MKDIEIPESEYSISFIQSSGPGGQNVNKLATKAELRWNYKNSLVLNERQKKLILEDARLSNLVNKEDEIVITDQTTRHQNRNKELVIEKLHEHLKKALTVKKRRKSTRSPRRANEKRLQNKKIKSDKKKSRKPNWD